jgi:S-adenosylmethionine:tRNA ribosyltransferase-isomerase
VLLGAGDWRTRTEDRPPPPLVEPGDTISIEGVALALPVTSVSPRSPRLVEVAIPAGDAAVRALFAAGRPVQYAHLARDLAPWDVQTVYGGRPWAVEMPSAGRPLTWQLLAELAGRGVKVASLTHAAGLSSTGDPALDASLPWPERYEVPPQTLELVRTSQRVIAVGTTVVRALESVARTGRASGITDLVIGPALRPAIVDGVLSGLHDPSESHFRLLEAFAPCEALLGAWHRARELGLRGHELGDSMLILR